MKHFLITLTTLLLLSVGLTACDEEQAEVVEDKKQVIKPVGEKQDTGFKVTVTDGDGWRMWEAEQRIFGTEPFMWVDNDTVIFPGAPRGWKKTGRGSGLYQWKVSEGIKQYWEKQDTGHWYCLSDKSLTIFMFNKNFKAGANVWSSMLVGWPGKFKEVKFPEKFVQDVKYGGYRFSDLRCNYIQVPEALKNRYWHALRSGDGHLDFGRKRFGIPSPSWFGQASNRAWAFTKKARLHNPEKGIDLNLPIQSIWVDEACITWYEFKAAYFLYDCAAPHGADAGEWHLNYWKETNCLPAWWLWPGGKTEKLCIPSGSWVQQGASSTVIPMKTGLAIIEISSFANSGLYRIGQSGVKNIAIGHIDTTRQRHMATISPDGCRIAFKFMPNRMDTGSERVRIVDFCVNKKGN